MTRSNAFIFDLDGTLVDSLRDITNALNRALGELEQSPVTTDEVQRWAGDGLPTLCQRALPRAGAETLDTFVRLAKEQYHRHCVDRTRPYPKVLQMLKLLRDRCEPMGVLSNKPHALVVEIVDRLDLSRFFAEVRGHRSEEDRKPSPRGALEIARLLDVAPHDVFVVGDSVVDIHTARNARMAAVAVAWGFQSPTQLLAAKPDFLVQDPMDIPELTRKDR